MTEPGISTEALTARIDAGETVTDSAEDYGLRGEEVENAVLSLERHHDHLEPHSPDAI